MSTGTTSSSRRFLEGLGVGRLIVPLLEFDDELLKLLAGGLLLELPDEEWGGSQADAIANVEPSFWSSQTTNLIPLFGVGVTVCGPKTWLPLLGC